MKVNLYDSEPGFEYELEYVAIIPRMNGKWLVARHAARDTWDFAGGHIEPGETAEEAALRELYEETGLVVEPQSAYVRRWKRTPPVGIFWTR